jgi:multicomponent Na+:H+ antiporter subunit E
MRAKRPQTPSDRGGYAVLLRALGLTALLFAFWLLLSGFFTPFLIAAGVGSAVAVALLARRMDVIDHEGQPLHLAPRAFLSYWPWLAKEILKSGWDVTRRVLDPRLPISPTLVRFRPLQRTAVGLVVHANSITLTPGTLTIDVAHGEFLVHALTAEGAAGAAAGGEMDQRVAALEGRP